MKFNHLSAVLFGTALTALTLSAAEAEDLRMSWWGAKAAISPPRKGWSFAARNMAMW